MNVVMVGPFGLKKKSTMRERALPMARALAKRGHRVSVIVPPWDSPEDAGKSRWENGVQIINTPLPKQPAPLFHITLTNWLAKLALQQNPDVIHFFKPKAYAGLAHLLLHTLRRLKRHSVRLVVDEDDWERAWNAIEPYSAAQKRLFEWQEPWGIAHADAVTVASKHLQFYAETLTAPERVFYVPNGVRSLPGRIEIGRAFEVWQSHLEMVAGSNAFAETVPPKEVVSALAGQRESHGLASSYHGEIRARYDLFGFPIVLLYTRFVEFKLPFLLDVMHRVHRRMPETRWLIVGEGFFREEKTLAEMIRGTALENRVIFAGWVEPAALSGYFAAANVAIHPYDDTPINRTKCSVKLLDLLAAGVSVVAGNVGQNAEYIRQRYTGLLVPPGDAAAMAEMVVTVLNNESLQSMLGTAAVQDVQTRFSWQKLVETVEAAYIE